MLLQFAESLRHAFRPKLPVNLYPLGLSGFSSGRTTFLAHGSPQHDALASQPSQNRQDSDESRWKNEQLNKRRRELYEQNKKGNLDWLDHAAERTRLYRQKVYGDKTLKEDYLARRQERDRRHYNASYDRRRFMVLLTWFQNHKDDISTYTWKRWSPVLFSENIVRTRAACGFRNRFGRRLWFVRKSDPELWDCMSCFSSSDLSDVVPIKGAERFYKGIYLKPQSTGNGGTVDPPDTHEAAGQKSDESQTHGEHPPIAGKKQGSTREPKQP